MPVGPQLNVEVSAIGATRVVSLSGELDISSSHRVVESLADVIDTDVIVDLRKVDFIDSSGLKMLVSEQKRLNTNGASLTLVVNEDGSVRRLLGITKLSDSFTIRTTIEQAGLGHER